MGYIGLSKVSHIQVDPGFALSIMPPPGHAALWNTHLPIERHSNYHLWFNANGTRPIGKIKLKCQIEDLRSEVTCYVINADISYNLLLG